jgi:hypothetical protein
LDNNQTAGGETRTLYDGDLLRETASGVAESPEAEGEEEQKSTEEGGL